MSPHNTQKSQNSQPVQGQTGSIVHFFKYPGETLAVMLRRFREEQNLDSETKLTYAGRLDPMAEGIVPILVDEARFQKDHLLGAQKTYEVSILLGISTDTADMLGMLTKQGISARKVLTEIEIKKAVEQLFAITELTYPNYSSRPVDGKALFVHARAGNKVKLPIKKVTIHDMELLKIEELPLRDLLSDAQEVIKKVQGDFRQPEILEQWSALAAVSADVTVQLVSICTTVSSGTYMRSLAEKMGEMLGVPALAYRIVRTKVGKE